MVIYQIIRCYRLNIVLFGLLLSSNIVLGQVNNLSSPFINSYKKKDYGGGTQTWEITQASNGILYFANNEGLLTFDGHEWEKFPQPKKTIARRIYLGDDKIYVGGQGEFGFFVQNEAGQLKYHSLVDQTPLAERQFSDVWDIFHIKGQLGFRTAEKVYLQTKDNFTVLQPPGNIIATQMVNGRLLLVLRDLGLYQLSGENFVPILKDVRFDKGQPVDILARSDDLLILDQKNGIWQYKDDVLSKWGVEADDFFQKHRIRNFALTKEGHIAAGTETGGILLLDKNGLPLTSINKQNGLQNNSVLSIFSDRLGQIWLGLENGIDQVQTGIAIGKVMPDGELEGKGFAACTFDNFLYLGTNNGLFVKPWKNYYSPLRDNQFELVPGTEGQVWGLDAIGDQLWLAHNDGIFLVKEKKATRIWSATGVWKYLDFGDHIIAGTYEGLISIKREDQKWRIVDMQKDFKESSRILVKQSNNEVWVSHPYRGIYKISLGNDKEHIEEVMKYGPEQGISNELNNSIFSIYDNLLIGSEKGILRYDAGSDNFIPFSQYNEYLGENNWIQRLYEDISGNIWYVKNNKPGFLRIKDHGLDKSISDYSLSDIQEDLVGGFEMIYPGNQQQVFIGAEKGFVLLHPKDLPQPDSSLSLTIQQVQVDDSLSFANKYYSSQPKEQAKAKFEKVVHSATFKFASVSLNPAKQIHYRHRLLGFEDEWTAWSARREKEFTNLGPGDYEFQVQAQDENLVQSEIASFSFEVTPPWYASQLALFIYALLSLGLLAGLVIIPRTRFQKEREELESAHNEVLEKTQEELMALKTEKLESEIKFKNQELASATMHWAQKAETLQGIKARLAKLVQEKPDQEAAFKQIRSLVRRIDQDTIVDDAWDQFALHFDEVHADFLKRIREVHPQISNNDLKLCAYLKMNLSTKEIAPLLNISIRGVEASRYRLRKKMGLSNEVNLAEYVMGF